MSSRTLRSALPAAIAIASSLLAGCTALASYPSWAGGGLAVEAPMREAEEDAQVARERARIAKQPREISAKHILVMHAESASRPDDVTRSRAEAYARAQQVLRNIRGGADFDQMVKDYSDEPGAQERGGDLGRFDRTQMVKPFAEAAFTLKVGEVSELVETKFGFHIIKRTE